MTTVPHIPDEIFVDILSYLTSADLAHVALASRHLYLLAQPLMYKEPELYDRHRYPSSVHSFIQTLLTPGYETLATHVRRLTVAWENEEIRLSDISFVTSAATRFGLGDRPLSGDLLVMILLQLLPNLHFLHLAPASHVVFRNFMYTMEPIGCQSLREFRCDSRPGLRPRALVTLLRLPHIRTLSSPIYGDIDLQMRGSDAVPVAHTSVSAIKRLEFSYARMPPAALQRILQVPRALTYFSYCATGTRGDAYSLPDLGKSLGPLRGSLETLVLDFSRLLLAQTGENETPTTTIGSLREWPMLRNVYCSLIPLLGKGPHTASPPQLADVLPAGIRSLRVLGDEYWSSEEAFGEVVVLLGQKETSVPRLERVVMSKAMVSVPEVKESLRVLCEVAAVVLAEDDPSYFDKP